MAQKKKDEPSQEKLLSDDELLEALAPAEKQLRALQQVKSMVDGYFAVKSELSAIESQRDEARKALEVENKKLEDTRVSINHTIVDLNNQVDLKREQLGGELKSQLNALSDQIENKKKQLAEIADFLKDREQKREERIKEIDDDLTARETMAKGIIEKLNEDILAKQKDFDRVTKAFADFQKRHGLGAVEAQP